MSPAELQIHRHNTDAFIAADPVLLTLVPHNSERTPSGGFKLTPGAPRTEQQLRLIPASDRMPEIKGSSGRLVKPEYILMGAWNAQMAQWDTFEFNGIKYEIASDIRPVHSATSIYQRKGDVVRKS